MICVPTSLAQEVGAARAQAGEERLREIIAAAPSGGSAPQPDGGPSRVATPDRGIGLELLPGTGRGDVKQVQLLIALLGREMRQPVPIQRSSSRLGKSPASRTRGHSRPLALCAVDSTRRVAAGCGVARRRRSSTKPGKARP
jgi:hypothetical protein